MPVARKHRIASATYVVSRISSFVFDNYTWSDNSGPWAYNKDTVVPSHIPLSALIQGMCPVSLLTAPDVLRDAAVALCRLQPALSPALRDAAHVQATARVNRRMPNYATPFANH